jgi:glycosyltransferase involved in cell wall biosynthesis
VPAVSILLPVFNAEATLEPCLESIQRQSLTHFECLVLNDGSGDRSLAMAQQFATCDGRFRVFDMPHRGIVATMNEGLAYCRAAIVARMDADDLMLSQRLQLQCEMLASREDLAGVGCHVRLFPRASIGKGRRRYERWLNSMRSPQDIEANIFVECPLAHPTWLVRKELYLAHPYRDGSWPEDYELLSRWSHAGYRFGVVPRPLLLWRNGAERLSRTDPRYGIDRFTELRARFLVAGPLERFDSYVLWGYGHTGKSLKRALLRLGRRPRKIIDVHPGRVGQRIEGVPVVGPEDIKPETDCPLLVSVAGDKPRKQIRAALAELKMIETQDYFCCA